ncbi:hypothetical protein J5U18_13530 [Sphingobacteriaceae bacterium WQ 2009]|uniref:Uncharacterized protein n=1 Tax=Rhinopithecimicrobium faecis TaxID=2820698 RepID=A0A8T4HCN9_9SPHI|nr:hypothetical protein [Sphingobacteriaceae bacterium WQ 2009]
MFLPCIKHSNLININTMATNGKPGDNRRHGAVKDRSQAFNPTTEQWVKSDTETGKFMTAKQDSTPFKGLRKESGK